MWEVTNIQTRRSVAAPTNDVEKCLNQFDHKEMEEIKNSMFMPTTLRRRRTHRVSV